MKKITTILLCFTVFSCSKPDETPSTPVANTDNKINLPTWLKGNYKCDHPNTMYPYPVTVPYGIDFRNGNDILIKGLSSSVFESLQGKIDGYISSEKLISVEEKYNDNVSGFDDYSILITTKPLPSHSYNEFIYFIITNTPLAGANKIHVIHNQTDNGSSSQYFSLQ